MTEPAVLRSLADRVEREPPSRELQEAIATALGWECGADGQSVFWRDPATDAWQMGLPEWLTSIDAAASMMPEGWRVASLFMWPDPKEWRCTMIRSGESECGIAPTEPQARVAAALRARAAEGGGDADPR
jgi:hypothetical protein